MILIVVFASLFPAIRAASADPLTALLIGLMVIAMPEVDRKKDG